VLLTVCRAERKKTLEKSQAAAAKKRNDNIAARSEARKNKRLGIKVKDMGGKGKKGRPGFEGKKGKGKSGGGAAGKAKFAGKGKTA
jgi:hypothetical protein